MITVRLKVGDEIRFKTDPHWFPVIYVNDQGFKIQESRGFPYNSEGVFSYHYDSYVKDSDFEIKRINKSKSGFSKFMRRIEGKDE